jgi:uncharacterized protein YndB with AHSA1/START domain
MIMPTTAHVYEIFIRATPERVWDALIDPTMTAQYFFGSHFESSFEPGAPYRSILSNGDDAVDGIVEVFEPPSRLVMTWHFLYDAALAEEPPSRVEWILTPANTDRTVTRVSLRHGDLYASPRTWAHVRLGWVQIIDSMKSLIETGAPLGPVDDLLGTGAESHDVSDDAGDDVDGQWHRSAAIAANSATWDLLDGRTGADDFTAAEADDLLNRAYAAAYHWARATGTGPANAARGSWLISRVHCVLGHGNLALHHAQRSAAVVAESGLSDFDLAYAHEALARALACLGRIAEAGDELARARSIAIQDPEDRSIFDGDLSAEPWFGLASPELDA